MRAGRYPTTYGQPITCAEVAAEAVRPIFRGKIAREQECLVVLLMDNKNKPIGKPFIAAMGTVSRVVVHPRDIFREAIRRNASGVLIAHNHPSNELALSDDDETLTERVISAGKILGIPLLDHLVLTTTGHLSFRDLGKIED